MLLLNGRINNEALREPEPLPKRRIAVFSIRRVLRGTSDGSQLTPIAFPAASGTAEGSALPGREFAYRLPDPTSRKNIEYYRAPAHGGYLSHMVADGEGPSLFYKTPGCGRNVKGKETSTIGGRRVRQRGRTGYGEDICEMATMDVAHFGRFESCIP